MFALVEHWVFFPCSKKHVVIWGYQVSSTWIGLMSWTLKYVYNPQWCKVAKNGCQPKNRGFYPPNHPMFNRVWNHYFHHPFWGFPIIFGSTPKYITLQCKNASRFDDLNKPKNPLKINGWFRWNFPWWVFFGLCSRPIKIFQGSVNPSKNPKKRHHVADLMVPRKVTREPLNDKSMKELEDAGRSASMAITRWEQWGFLSGKPECWQKTG